MQVLEKQELIKTHENEDGEILVSARDLHKGLNIKTRFSLWVTQNFKMFSEGIDFTGVVSTTAVNNGAVQELQDYAMSLEMAKHIAMMTGSEKGYEVRNYFLQIERLWNSPDMVMKRALEFANKRVYKLQIENKEMKPKALFADAVAASHTSILIGELAKLISQNGIPLGQNRLFIWLRQHGFLIKRKGSDFNMPTQKSIEMGLFEIKERSFTDPSGAIKITKTPKVTGKGQQYFINKFLDDKE